MATKLCYIFMMLVNVLGDELLRLAFSYSYNVPNKQISMSVWTKNKPEPDGANG